MALKCLECSEYTCEYSVPETSFLFPGSCAFRQKGSGTDDLARGNASGQEEKRNKVEGGPKKTTGHSAAILSLLLAGLSKDSGTRICLKPLLLVMCTHFTLRVKEDLLSLCHVGSEKPMKTFFFLFLVPLEIAVLWSLVLVCFLCNVYLQWGKKRRCFSSACIFFKLYFPDKIMFHSCAVRKMHPSVSLQFQPNLTEG